MNTEKIKEICKLQHKDLLYKILIKKMPIAYTNYDMGQMEHDMKIRSDYEKNTSKISKIVDEVGVKAINETFGNPEIMKNPENRFTYEDQKNASKEVLGLELTLEEVFDKYNL